MDKPLARIINLIDPQSQQILNMNSAAAERLLLSGESTDVGGIEGSFALLARDGERVALARSLDRPMRYFLAKEKAGPMLIVADRIDAIRQCLIEHGYENQFHPTYTRMVPAHHVTHLQLVGCPDPNPQYLRFFDPPRATLEADLDAIADAYVAALLNQVRTWLLALPEKEPLGVLFSGGVDSGSVLLAVYHQLLALGQSPSRLKAFTLAVDGGGGDAEQAGEFLRQVNLEMLGETVEIAASQLDPLRAIEVVEDYKSLDVECATVAMALLGGIRSRYPEWRYLADGDGGDENLKDYPIEENPELTIRSVVGNSMLYQEGWGVEAIKHSLTFSGGQSRGCVRTYAPLAHHGFLGFSPFTRPEVIRVAEAIPFDELSQGDHEKLYALKGEIMKRGILKHTGIEMPVFPKCRFQHGSTTPEQFSGHFSMTHEDYRQHFLKINSLKLHST